MRSLILCLGLLFSLNTLAQLSLEKPRVRAMPPGQPNTAAFMTVVNNGQADVRLISASTNIATKSEFHQHKMSANGVMSMSRVEYIDIKAGQSFEFNSGGYHIMIMGLNKQLIPGEKVELKLLDSKGQQYDFILPVLSIMAAQKLEKNNHHHH